ncbi:MAG: DUF4163 domain-containing protein, partial [Marinirhabdus sp.]|nr:DUF4163 domain-containing protein [Marinirhabdus sp.]
MNHKILRLLFILMLFNSLVGCKKALEFESKTISEDGLENCKAVACPNLDIDFITVQGDSEQAQKINSILENYIIQSLYIGESETGSDATSIEEAMAGFIKMYRVHSAEFPGLSAEYFAEITVAPTYNSKDILSVSASSYLYTGGAHGLGTTRFFNFDPQTGKQLFYEDVFKDPAIVEKAAEDK